MRREFGFKFDVVAGYDNFMKYNGHAYGVPTDGNVRSSITGARPDRQSRQQTTSPDEFGTDFEIADAWEETCVCRSS